MSYSLLSNDFNKKNKTKSHSLLGNWEDPNDYENKLDTRIANYETRFEAIGEKPPEPEKKTNFLMKTLDIIDRPRNAIINAIQDVKTGENNALQGAWEGLTGKEKAYVSDLLPENMNKYAKAGLGFVGDVLADPLTYLTLGTAGVAKKGLQEGAEALTKRNVLKFAGKEIADVTPIGNALKKSKMGMATAPLRQGIADIFQPIFNTKYVMGGAKMIPEEQLAIQGVVNDIANLPQRIKGEQQIALSDIKKAWDGVSPQSAEEATKIIENTAGIYGSESLKAANIAKKLTDQTASKDIAAGIEFDLRDNYIKHLYKEDKTAQVLWDEFKKSFSGRQLKPGTKASFQKERKFDTYEQFEEWAKKKGVPLTPIYDARVLTAVREMEGVYKRASNALYDNIANSGEFVLKEAYDVNGKKIVPNNWVEIPGIKQLKGKAVHPEIARHLNRFNEVFTTDTGIRNLSSVFNSAQNVWKGLVTASVPFHLRNAIGNVYNNFLAGVINPNIYTMAAGIQKGLNGKFVLAGKEYTSDGLLNEFRKQGLEGFGVYQGETLKSLTKEAESAFGTSKLSIKNLNPLSAEFAPVKGSRWAGDKIETNAKLTHFIDRLSKGDTPEKAAESVRKYLFDYSDLTQAEKKIRAFVPFYTWTRKNIPLQLESLVTQPGKPSAVNKLVENMRNTQGASEDDIPEWMREEMAIPIMVNKDGTQSYLMPDIPLTNLNMIGGGDTLKNAFGMLSPLAKVPIELAMNKQAFTGAPIEKYEGSWSKFGNLELPSKLAYGLSQLGSIPRTAADIAGSLSEETPSLSPIPQAPKRDPLTSIALGSLLRDVNPDRERVLKKIQRDQQLGDFRKLLEEVHGKEVPTINDIKGNGKKNKSLLR